MTENVNIEDLAIPEVEVKNETAETADTTPQTEQKEILVPVKFNKETKAISLQEASELAQKGMKFEMISKDFDSLRQLAKEEGQSITEFLNALTERRKNDKKNELLAKCGGDEELANHIFELEVKTTVDNDMGFSELKERFPEFDSVSNLPEQVVENARLKGTLLLDEYLRFKLDCKQTAQAAAFQQQTAEKSSTGSQTGCISGLNPEASEFLRGLWR